LKSLVFGTFTVSTPYFNYGGPLASMPEIEEALLTYAIAHSDTLGCSHMEIRETHARASWRSVQRKVSMILQLPASDEILDEELGSKVRAQVNKAVSNDLHVRFGGMDLLDHFYQVFSHNMRDLGTPVYGKRFFADIIRCFPEAAFIAIVYRYDKPLAAGFLFGYREKLEIPWASSIRSQNHLGANMLMYRSILAEAISRKYEFFDFGRSTINASTYRFKKQWGAKEHPLHWHYWTQNDREVPEINPDNPKYKLVISVWKMLPVFVTRIIGPFIARNLP
jgi:FemAB-related protein (PEP-CTERM system-associated)